MKVESQKLKEVNSRSIYVLEIRNNNVVFGYGYGFDFEACKTFEVFSLYRNDFLKSLSLQEETKKVKYIQQFEV